jgi:hypothetical protein
MAPLVRLLGGAWLRALLLTEVGGAGLLALVVLTESTATGATAWGRLVTDVPHAWALLSPALALIGAALAVQGLRRRGDWLALGTLGVPRGRLLLSVLLLAVPLGLFAAGVEALTEPASAVLRVSGGWLVEGQLLLDPGAAPPSEDALSAARWRGSWRWPGTAIFVAACEVAGAALGARAPGSAVLLSTLAWVVVDLLRRGSTPAGAAGWSLVVCAAAALALAWALSWESAAARSPARR